MAKNITKKNEKPELTPEQKEALRRIKQEKERKRSQLAFATLLETMIDMAREEVNHAAIELWRAKLNKFRRVGEKILVKDFLALTDLGDPFNADAPRNRELAEWFVEQWHRFKPGARTVHVRGLHYNIATLADTPHAVYLPNGKLYDNTDHRWNDLQRAGKYARYLGLIDPELFEDRRSKAAILKEFSTSSRSIGIYDHLYTFYTFELEGLPAFPDFPSMPDFPDPPSYYLNFTGQQRYRLEVRIEKSTQESVILPVCEHYQVTSVTAQGEISISSMWQAVKRAERYGDMTETIILYISDFDPAGKSMPVAASRKLEFLRWFRHSNVKMRLEPIALTYEQCQQYQLPRTPLKESDKRKLGFEKRYGSGATELDALESLHPGELAKLLEQAILEYRDSTVEDRVRRKRWSIRQELDTIEKEIHGQHGMDDLKEEYERVADALAPIEEEHDLYEGSYAEFKSQYNENVRRRFNQWYTASYEPLRTKLSTATRAVSDEMQKAMPDIDAYEMPEAKEVPPGEDCLYDSSRDYMPQLATYKQFAGKFSHLVGEEEEDEGEVA